MNNYLNQDKKVNSLNTKGRIITFLFRLGKQLNKNKFYRVIFLPYLIFYRVFVEWVLGIELPLSVIAGKNLRIFHGQSLVVNPEVVIGENVTLRHSITIGNKSENGKCPIIGNNVDIGCNVIIIGDIKIGNNVIIGAGSVVVKNLESNSIYAGNPAYIIRKIK